MARPGTLDVLCFRGCGQAASKSVCVCVCVCVCALKCFNLLSCRVKGLMKGVVCLACFFSVCVVMLGGMARLGGKPGAPSRRRGHTASSHVLAGFTDMTGLLPPCTGEIQKFRDNCKILPATYWGDSDISRYKHADILNEAFQMMRPHQQYVTSQAIFSASTWQPRQPISLHIGTLKS